MQRAEILIVVCQQHVCHVKLRDRLQHGLSRRVDCTLTTDHLKRTTTQVYIAVTAGMPVMVQIDEAHSDLLSRITKGGEPDGNLFRGQRCTLARKQGIYRFRDLIDRGGNIQTKRFKTDMVPASKDRDRADCHQQQKPQDNVGCGTGADRDSL